MTVSAVYTLLSILGILFFAQVAKIIYRIFLHPLARFPGPKLAAASSLYSTYYNLVKGGQYTEMLPCLHDLYGPIVRTHPNELHIRDIAAYNTIFKMGTPFSKDRQFYGFPFEGSHFSMTNTKSAKGRRDLLQPHLSHKAVKEIQPLLERSLGRFLEILERARDNGESVDLSLGYRCVTIDMLLGYAFGQSRKALNSADFDFPPAKYMDDVLFGSLLVKHFPGSLKLIFGVVLYLPRLITKKLVISSMIDMKESCCGMLLELIDKRKHHKQSHSTMFDTAIDQVISESPKAPTIQDLTAEALVLLFAGGEATAISLIKGTFHMLKDGNEFQKLKNELHSAMPDPQTQITIEELGRLPYLRGLVKESLRFTQGAPGRLPRIVPDGGVTLCGEFIPAKTIVSSSHYVYHFDPHVFKDPMQFRPERWLKDEDREQLEKQLLSFSRGSRACIGINLAYAELYLVFAHVFRRFNFRLDGTTDDEMELRDYYAPMAKGHLKVIPTTSAAVGETEESWKPNIEFAAN
ncbi:cytochrome P450 [Aspergillus alliaceus]|uniref:cytochrome P450 n=1 Tax=Petromyces alliaceus TaxID=209559 RepID=UPI0012A5EE97|nr:cytochrome P450 [Aspergillus alliaceus]KAB8227357.1 cytochrome P450 [Aspergillus alliaceus]